MLTRELQQSLPQRAYCATQVLENEAKVAQRQGIAMAALMEKAGQAVFSHIQTEFSEAANILVLCGKGNNGGDGFVVARLAYELGLQVTVYLTVDDSQLKGDAKTAFARLAATNITVLYQSELTIDEPFIKENQYDLIVDALFGIGFKGALPEALHPIVSAVNACSVPILSVDVPSGLNSSTGDVDALAISASQTVTFIVLKQGLMTGQAANHVGMLYLADLSLGEGFQQLIASSVIIQGSGNDGAQVLPNAVVRKGASHKGSIGRLVAVGGDQGFPGAIRLASEAALRTGAALVSVYCHQANQAMVHQGRPELMLISCQEQELSTSHAFNKAKVLLCGPGLGQSSWGETLFKQVINADAPCVLDADGLQWLAKYPQYKNNWVLTPHPGEAAALLHSSVEEVERDRFAAVKALVQRYGGICVLKGAGTLIANDKTVWLNTSGNSGMASGGMGDVLSGIIAALLMQMDGALDAVRLAVYIHGLAADRVAQKQGKIGMLASDLFPEIQRAMNQTL